MQDYIRTILIPSHYFRAGVLELLCLKEPCTLGYTPTKWL